MLSAISPLTKGSRPNRARIRMRTIPLRVGRHQKGDSKRLILSRSNARVNEAILPIFYSSEWLAWPERTDGNVHLPPRLSQGRPHQPCHSHATSDGQVRSLADNHGHCHHALQLAMSAG
jgi:hypothetical protein